MLHARFGVWLQWMLMRCCNSTGGRVHGEGVTVAFCQLQHVLLSVICFAAVELPSPADDFVELVNNGNGMHSKGNNTQMGLIDSKGACVASLHVWWWQYVVHVAFQLNTLVNHSRTGYS